VSMQRIYLCALACSCMQLQDFTARKHTTCHANFPLPLIKDGWTETMVPISVPCDNVSYPSDADAPIFHVKGLHIINSLKLLRLRMRNPPQNNFIFCLMRNTGNRHLNHLQSTSTPSSTTLMPIFKNKRRSALSSDPDVNSKRSLLPL